MGIGEEEEHDERRMTDHRALLAAKSVLVLHSTIAAAVAAVP